MGSGPMRDDEALERGEAILSKLTSEVRRMRDDEVLGRGEGILSKSMSDIRLMRDVEVLGRGEGILSKSMSDVRATGRKDDLFDFAGETAGRALARLCIGPVVNHPLLDNTGRNKEEEQYILSSCMDSSPSLSEP